ncbi:MAG: hypothetical protein GKR86_04020, partial [Ilumatobacter sp.]|nr:hypothetical protein [Ilumatobacter sp.]
LGYGISAASAAKVAAPDRQCIALLGDGALGLQAMELDTPADKVARSVLYIHPALTEVVENAILDALTKPDPIPAVAPASAYDERRRGL